MARVRVQLDHAGMRDLLTGPIARAVVEGKAERAAARARDIAPVDTGAYRNSIHVEVVQHRSRVVARVVAGTDHALVVEASHRTLGRSVDAAKG